MITIVAEKLNPISQDFYDNVIFSLDLALLSCTCGHTGDLIWYGSYKRKVKLPEGELSLRVARVFCKNCGCTHALLLTSIVPYSQIPLDIQAAVVQCWEQGGDLDHILDRHLSIDESNVSSIVRSYRLHWRERLLSVSVPILSVRELIHICFSVFSRQFMQIKCTRNKLFLVPT